MMIVQLIEIAATWMECIVGILIVSKLSTDIDVKWKNLIVTSFIVMLGIFGANQFKLVSLFATLAGILGIAFGAKVLCKTKIEDCLVLSVAYILIIYIIDFFCMSVLGILFQNEQFGFQIMQEYSVWRIYHIVLAKVILGLFYIFLSRVLTIRIQPTVRKIWAGIMIVGILVVYFGSITIKTTTIQLLVVWLFIISIVVFGGYSVAQYMDYCTSRDEMKLAEERNRMLAENYERLISDYRDNQIYNHDLKNHYLVLQRMIKDKKFDMAEQYVDSMEDIKAESLSKNWTGIPILDILLEYKMNEARKEQIHFEILADKIQLQLTDQEIVALFGNAIDNAIDACRKMEKKERWIRIAVRKNHDMTFIKITNSFEGLPEVKEMKLLSTKNTKKEFGWGITSMKLIVEKYEGILNSSYKGDTFVLVVSFFC